MAASFFDIPGGPELPTAGSGGSGGGAAVWGSITGTLGDQTDLNGALAGKLPLDGSSQMTGELKLVDEDPDDAENSSLFFDENNSGRPTWKASDGTYFDLVEGSTGTIPGP